MGADERVSLPVVPLEVVRYDAQTGLVPVIVQDAASGGVLMLAYADREALKRTLATGEAWFWSRSRRAYWHKGATSGNVQRVREVRLDCDGDAVLYLVDPAGPACHTGETSCFHRAVQHGETPATEAGGELDVQTGDLETTESRTAARSGTEDAGVGPGTRFVPLAARGEAGEAPDALAGDEVLRHLWQVMEARWAERPTGSYTTYLFTQGVDKIAKKVGEEAVEVALAAKNAAYADAGRSELARESADLLYHLFALWKLAGITPADVYEVLSERARPE